MLDELFRVLMVNIDLYDLHQYIIQCMPTPTIDQVNKLQINLVIKFVDIQDISSTNFFHIFFNLGHPKSMTCVQLDLWLIIYNYSFLKRTSFYYGKIYNKQLTQTVSTNIHVSGTYLTWKTKFWSTLTTMM